MFNGLKLFASTTALVGILCVGIAPAHADFTVQIQTPFVRFAEPPPLIEVEPGIQVVQGFNEEVFYIDGYYWVRRHGRWFRSSQWDGSWSYVERSYLPRFVVSAPRGYYRRWEPRYGQSRGNHWGHRYQVNVQPAPPRYVDPAPRYVDPPAPRVVVAPPRYVAPPAPRVNVSVPAPRVFVPAPRVITPPPAPRVNISVPAPRVNVTVPGPVIQRRPPVQVAPPAPGRRVGPPNGHGHGR